MVLVLVVVLLLLLLLLLSLLLPLRLITVIIISSIFVLSIHVSIAIKNICTIITTKKSFFMFSLPRGYYRALAMIQILRKRRKSGEQNGSVSSRQEWRAGVGVRTGLIEIKVIQWR